MHLKAAAKWLGTTLAVAGSAAFVLHVLNDLKWHDLASRLTPPVIAALVLCTLVYMTLVPLSALAWRRLLHALGSEQPYLRLLGIVSVTQAAKYLPGNIGQHVGRVGLAMASGISLAIVSASIVYEICLLLLANLLVGLLGGAASSPGLAFLLGKSTSSSSPWLLCTLIVLIVAGLCASPLLSRLLGRLVRRAFKGKVAEDTLPNGLGPRTILEVVLIYVVAVLLMGLSLWGIAAALHPTWPDYALVTAAFTLAWAVGFVTPGAPAGLGIREALLLFMLSPFFGSSDASLITLTLRIVTTLGDMACLLSGLPLLHRLRSQQHRASEQGNLP